MRLVPPHAGDQLRGALSPHPRRFAASAQTGGSVINIGSVNAWSGEPNLMPYSVSKGALMTLTRNLGDTLMREDGVRVNQINPGWVLTENEAKRKREHGLKDDWYADLPKVYAPAGRILWPEEIAACAAWLLADECGPISGQVFDLEQHPFIGRNPPKDASTIPAKPLASDTIKGGSLDHRVAIGSGLSLGLIVGDAEEDVGPLRR
jgi:NAD(P)-dependent dehydrogenase (short-subunit alcohol dehydrogenase family)